MCMVLYDVVTKRSTRQIMIFFLFPKSTKNAMVHAPSTRQCAVHLPKSLPNTKTMSITIELLDSMLAAPAPDNLAEAHYRTIPLDSKLRQLTSLLTHLYNNNAAEAGRCMLAAVLLRREVETLAGKLQFTGLNPSSAVSLMGEIAIPLMSLFLRKEAKQSKRQIGHIIAELSSSLSQVSVEDGEEWMKTVLNHIRPGVSIFVVASSSLWMFNTHMPV